MLFKEKNKPNRGKPAPETIARMRRNHENQGKLSDHYYKEYAKHVTKNIKNKGSPSVPVPFDYRAPSGLKKVERYSTKRSDVPDEYNSGKEYKKTKLYTSKPKTSHTSPKTTILKKTKKDPYKIEAIRPLPFARNTGKLKNARHYIGLFILIFLVTIVGYLLFTALKANPGPQYINLEGKSGSSTITLAGKDGTTTNLTPYELQQLNYHTSRIVAYKPETFEEKMLIDELFDRDKGIYYRAMEGNPNVITVEKDIRSIIDRKSGNEKKECIVNFTRAFGQLNTIKNEINPNKRAYDRSSDNWTGGGDHPWIDPWFKLDPKGNAYRLKMLGYLQLATGWSKEGVEHSALYKNMCSDVPFLVERFSNPDKSEK